jgi:hypothetical protein
LCDCSGDEFAYIINGYSINDIEFAKKRFLCHFRSSKSIYGDIHNARSSSSAICCGSSSSAIYCAIGTEVAIEGPLVWSMDRLR